MTTGHPAAAAVWHQFHRPLTAPISTVQFEALIPHRYKEMKVKKNPCDMRHMLTTGFKGR
jgi:hypothetical protein